MLAAEPLEHRRGVRKQRIAHHDPAVAARRDEPRRGELIQEVRHPGLELARQAAAFDQGVDVEHLALGQGRRDLVGGRGREALEEEVGILGVRPIRRQEPPRIGIDDDLVGADVDPGFTEARPADEAGKLDIGGRFELGEPAHRHHLAAHAAQNRDDLVVASANVVVGDDRTLVRAHHLDHRAVRNPARDQQYRFVHAGRQIGDTALFRAELRQQRQDAVPAAVDAERIEQEAARRLGRSELDRDHVIVDVDVLDETKRRPVIQSAGGGDPVHRLLAQPSHHLAFRHRRHDLACRGMLRASRAHATASRTR